MHMHMTVVLKKNGSKLSYSFITNFCNKNYLPRGGANIPIAWVSSSCLLLGTHPV